MNIQPAKSIDILMAEDSPNDVILMRKALEYAGVPITLHVVGTGEEALAYLRREGNNTCAKRPDMVLLDLKMPGKGGHEVLFDIKSDESFRAIPVVIFSSSETRADVGKAYKYHANCYIAKPVDFDAFVEVLRSLQSFWFSIVTLPPTQT